MLSKRVDLSLNCVIRSSSPSGVTLFKSHCSSVCSGTCDWTNNVARSGSMPEASSPNAMSRVRWARLPASYLAGDRVQVDDREETLVRLLQPDPVLDRAEQVAEVQLAGGLNPREDSWHRGKLSGTEGPRKMPSANDLLTIAVAAAQAAGAYLRAADRPHDPAGWTSKGRADWATDVDRGSEQIITRMLAEATPGSRVVGEELSPEVVNGGLVWIVDPLDGTTNFLHGFPAFAVSIAAAVDGQLEAGAVLHVPLDRLTTATRGGGTWEAGHRLAVSTITDPAHALIGTGFPYLGFDRLDAIPPTALAGAVRGDRGSTPRLGGNRSGGCSRRPFRRVLGAPALGLGYRGGHLAGTRSRGPGHRPNGARPRRGAWRNRGGKPRHPPLAAGGALCLTRNRSPRSVTVSRPEPRRQAAAR